MAEVTILPAAAEEYRRAWFDFAAYSRRTAAKFEAAIEEAFARIAASPEAFPLEDEQHRLLILTKYPYYIVYRITAEGVVIVSVAHGRRSERFWQGR